MCKCTDWSGDCGCNDRPFLHEQSVAAKVAQPHKHAATIKAWADGAEIEVKGVYPHRDKWVKSTNPSWNVPEFEYRVKPTPVPLWQVAKDAWYSQPIDGDPVMLSQNRWEAVVAATIKAYKEQEHAST